MIWLVGVIVWAALGIAWISLIVFYWLMRVLFFIVCLVIGIFSVAAKRIRSL